MSKRDIVINDNLDKKYKVLFHELFGIKCIYINYIRINESIIDVNQGILYILTKFGKGSDLLNINW